MSSSSSSYMMIPFLVFLSLITPASAESFASEKSILLIIKKQWGANASPFFSSWEPTTSPCSSWAGIKCSAGGSVTAIFLSNATLSTQIPPSLCHLKNLSLLDLSWNFIPYGFPKALYTCSSLTHLDLSHNRLLGPFPPDFHKLSSSLRHLHLGNNHFTGKLPIVFIACFRSNSVLIKMFKYVCGGGLSQYVVIKGRSF